MGGYKPGSKILSEPILKLQNTRKMKKIFTFLCKSLLTILVANCSFNSVKAQTCTSPTMSWKNPVLVSGTALQTNAVYKFQSVTSGVYALVTITAIVGGATLTSIDDLTYGYNAAWQPVVKTPTAQVACDSYVSFKIEFKDSVNNNNHQYNCFQLSFIDVDGDNDDIREFVATKSFDSYTVSNTTSLTITNISGGFTQATGPLTEYSGIDTSAYNTNINFRYTNKYKIDEVRVGNRVDADFNVQSRYTCAYFAQISMPYQILSVNYLSFDAVVNDKSVLLKWITAQEINNSHFEVERSFDNDNYKTIGLVLDGFTVNGTGKSYQFKDYSLELQGRSIVYYRLKQFDNDGRVTYSKVLVVRFQAKSDGEMQVSPNPFTENLNLRFTAVEDGIAQIYITNMNGQTLVSKQSTISKGYNNILIDGLSGFDAGMYTARVFLNGTLIHNQKVMKIKAPYP